MILDSYNRVSTDDQKTGMQVYRESIERFCQYGGHQIDITFEDEDVSGGLPFRERPAGKLLFNRLMNGEVDGMVADNVSRVFRSAADGFATIELFRDAGVKFFICDQGQVPLDIDSEQGFIMFTIQLMTAQLERMKVKKRTADAHKVRRKIGLATSHAQYGYDKIVTHHGDQVVKKLVVNTDEMLVVKQMFQWRSEGMSFYSIAKTLNEMNIQAKKGGSWTGKTVQGVIEYHNTVNSKNQAA